jgi:hypothetical protein
MQRIEAGPGLDGVDVLVVDEAAMTDDRQIAAVLAEAARTGTKVVAIGDPQQLRAIGPGGGFAEVHRIVGGHVLAENRRQRDAGERAALEVWRTGARQEALEMLAAAERVHAVDTAEDARTAVLAAWDVARGRWADPHDQLAELVVLAARNDDVTALNHGAQAIRRAAGELGNQHTYALPGGNRITLAVGDIIRVRANDYRSRRGHGPDLLNGYRAVVDGLDAQHRVRITWRTPAGGRESAWVTADQVAGGALSLGYAMTIAASQGLTATTALTYGHGADAYALYPGITRAREANHLWLPIAALEDEETQARLGQARSQTERLQRAVAAYAKLLQQDRPDTMVSDHLRPAPEPAATVPGQRSGSVLQEPAAPPVQPWPERQYGHLRGNLETAAAKAEQQAAAQRATAADAGRKAAALAAVLDTDHQPARVTVTAQAARLDAAARHLARADQLDQHHEQIDAQVRTMYETNRTEQGIEWRVRERAALKRSALIGTRRGMQRDADALRRRITDRTAQIETLRRQSTGLRDEARTLRDQAKELIARGRQYADHRPLPVQLAERRAELPMLAARLDDYDRREHQHLSQKATGALTRAAELTERAARLRAEAGLRRTLTPEQADAEATGRARAAQQATHARQAAAKRAAQQQRARAIQDHRYQPPAPDRHGPSRGR